MTSSPDSSLHILIVEDNRTQAEYLRHLLEKKGHQVTVANNGYEAIERIQEKKPDIILTDVMMPDMDGYTLCKTVKKDEKSSDIPIILVTHLYSPVDVIKGLEAGADNFIIKPYDPEYIFSRIASIMQAKEHPKNEESYQPLDVVFSSEVHTIASSRMQILNILLSTYETAVKNNSELQVAHERLHYTNAQLQKLIEDLEQTNESLHLKNLERGRLETALHTATEKIETLSAALRQITNIQVKQSADLLAEYDENRPDSSETVKGAYHLMKNAVTTLLNTQSYIRSGSGHRTWQPARNLIHSAITTIRTQAIRYENLIPEDIEVYVDSCLGTIMTDIVLALQDPSLKAGEIRFSFHVTENGYSLFLENDGQGIPESDKERIFSVEEGLNLLPPLYLVREVLKMSGLTITETGVPGHGTRYEIAIPEGSIRFASDITKP